MKLRWLGHSCFLITTYDGKRILTDPFDETVGYVSPGVTADFITISHDHFDHSYISEEAGEPTILKHPGSYTWRDLSIWTVETYHDNEAGLKRGNNLVFVIESEGIRVVHLGDLGHVPDGRQRTQIGRVDVLLIPVGGRFTIDAQQAASVVAMLSPKVVIPMHYKTEALSFPLDPVDAFLDLVGGAQMIPSTTLEITQEDLKQNDRRICVLQYA
ncbi:MAG: MBL fold metallo-hydrolase [Bacillota bacterium]